MLGSLFRTSRAAAPTPRIPDDVRVYAIGDVHGRDDLLRQLLDQIDADDASRTPKPSQLIFLGDLIDRGEQSAAVVDRVLRLTAERQVRVLGGNHEELLLRTLSGDKEAARIFVRAGGRETILSYGVTAANYDRADFDELPNLIRAHMPSGHIAFLEGLEDMIEIGDYAFVHAGIRPGVPLAEQKPEHLRWIRSGFLDHKQPHPRIIVHGHTITETIDERPNRIGIDTGAYATGRLTAMGLDGDERWFIATA
ncbi:metallophosphoesterase family protein [Sphingomonas floccifaciens]|uniref:Metallophosphoesterase family protein n=1 Tax=Sphingomonas floccifaciens TaxID=1844115 RepID=A0ABW4NEG3_9SPHN